MDVDNQEFYFHKTMKANKDDTQDVKNKAEEEEKN